MIAIVAVCSHLLSGSQVQPRPTSKDKPLSANASCYDDAATGKLVGSRTSRTSVLVSPDGRFQAYAESDAVAPGLANRPECSNTSRLLVAGRDSRKFQIVLTIETSPESLGNGIDLIDWSPKGHRLLLAQGSWQYFSDVGETRVRIYDADSGSLSSGSIVDEAFSRYVRKTCAGIFQPVGFSSSGKIIVTAAPFFEVGEDKPAGDSCVQKKGFWLIDSAIPTLSQLPDNYRVERYAKVAS
jgi:hypothetical protein